LKWSFEMTFEPLSLLAQMDGDEATAAAAGAAGLVLLMVQLVVSLVVIAGNWKVYSKAGKPGWACIIPVYNMVVLLEIVGRPIWWIVLLLIPCVNIVVLVILFVDLAKSFGKDGAFAAGLVLLSPIFILILGFGSAEYQGPAALAGGGEG